MRLVRHTLPIFALVIALQLVATTSHAFRYEGAGMKVGMLDPEGSDAAPAVSGHMEFHQPGTSWHLMPSVMFWNADRLSGLSGNFDMYYHFVPGGQPTPYIGTGVGVNYFDPDGPDNGSTRLGLNLFGGLRFPAGGSRLFVEGRYTASELSQISILGGVTFLRH